MGSSLPFAWQCWIVICLVIWAAMIYLAKGRAADEIGNERGLDLKQKLDVPYGVEVIGVGILQIVVSLVFAVLTMATAHTSWWIAGLGLAVSVVITVGVYRISLTAFMDYFRSKEERGEEYPLSH